MMTDQKKPEAQCPLIPAPMLSAERAHFETLVAEFPPRSMQDAEDYFVFGIQYRMLKRDKWSEPKIRDWLIRHEWSGFEYDHTGEGVPVCPDCGQFKSDGHATDCELA